MRAMVLLFVAGLMAPAIKPALAGDHEDTANIGRIAKIKKIKMKTKVIIAATDTKANVFGLRTFV